MIFFRLTATTKVKLHRIMSYPLIDHEFVFVFSVSVVVALLRCVSGNLNHAVSCC